ncbi:MAG: amidohydrolase family protein [Pseudomonadota bacterium]
MTPSTLSRCTLLAALCGLAHGAAAQSPPVGPELKKFLKFEASLVALTHVRVIDGSGAPAQDERTIIVRDGKIEAITDAATAAPAGARVLDLSGRTVMPGLVGMHNHLFYTASTNRDEDDKIPLPGRLVTEVAFSAPRLYLAAGVTSMRSTGSIEPTTDLNIAQLIERGQIPGPHIDVTGPYLEGPDSLFVQMANSSDADKVRQTIDYWSAQGATSFKAYMRISQQVLGAAIVAAHKHGAKVTGHLCSVDYRQAAALGIDDLEHGPVFTDAEFVPDRKAGFCPPMNAVLESWAGRDIASAPVQELIADLIKHKVALTSTLPVFEAYISTRPLLSKRQLDVMSAESARSYLYERASTARNAEFNAKFEAALKKEMAFELAFARAGGLLIAGPDPTGNGGVLPGFGDQRELELLVEAGFSPLEAIRVATANGAQYQGQLARIGTIAPGKNADLVVLLGDPSRRISDIENVELVFKDGLAYDPAKLIASVRGMLGTR